MNLTRRDGSPDKPSMLWRGREDDDQIDIGMGGQLVRIGEAMIDAKLLCHLCSMQGAMLLGRGQRNMTPLKHFTQSR